MKIAPAVRAIFFLFSLFLGISSQTPDPTPSAGAAPTSLTSQFGSTSDPSACTIIDEINNGYVERVGNKAIYGCNPSYTLVGPTKRNCACGEWTGSEPECRRDGNWGEWSPYSDCTRTCGGGWQRRQRFCDNPPPNVGGKSCPGCHAQRRKCNNFTCTPECPVKGTLLFGPLNITSSGFYGKKQLLATCTNGYFLSSPSLATLDCASYVNGTGIDFTQFCIRSCPDLKPLANGTLTLSPNDLEANYECNFGFVLKGSERLVCKDGEWIGTEPVCTEGLVAVPHFPDFTDIVGADPTILIRKSSLVQSQTFFLPFCYTIISFNYRTSAVRPVTITAELITATFDEGHGSFVPSVIAQGGAIIEPNGTESRFFCLEVNDCVNDTLVPTAAAVRTLVHFDYDEVIFEISDFSVNERLTCPGSFEAIVYSNNTNCSDSVISGDCGYTNDPLGYSSFFVGLKDENEDVDKIIPVAKLQLKKTSISDECNRNICVPCFVNSGITISQKPLLRERREDNYKELLKYFCTEKSICRANSPEILKDAAHNEFVYFQYEVPPNDCLLHLSLTCIYDSNRKEEYVNLGAIKSSSTPPEVFALHFKGSGLKKDSICLNLHKNLDSLSARGVKCTSFRFHLVAAGGRNICVRNIVYFGRKHSTFRNICHKIHNE